MQKDLLVAVKVANDFKIEAQKEMLKLSERITELQKRRQSAAFTVSQGSAITLYEKNFQSWEDKAWQRLMLGCERGLFVCFFFFSSLIILFSEEFFMCDFRFTS